MMAFRFANGMFEPIWNRNYIDHVQITAAEDLGIGSRAGYYDNVGRAARPGPEPHAPAARAARDGAAGARSRPTRSATRRSRCCTRSARRPRTTIDAIAVRGQYGPGIVGGEEVPGYLRGGGRARRTPTPRPTRRCGWRSTTGAGPACRSTCAPASGWRARSPRSRSRSSPSRTSPSSRTGSVGVQPNQLILTLQPNEGVSLSLGAKIPGSADADPPGEHGVPLRHVVPVAVARGLRAADPRRDARRRHAVHPQRRGRGAVARSATRSSARLGGDAGAAAAVPGRLAGPGRGRARSSHDGDRGARSEAPADADASTRVWSAQDTTPGDIDAALRKLLTERHRENDGYVPGARAQPRRAWSTRVARRDRQPARARRAATTRRARSSARSSRGRTTLDAVATIAAPSEVARAGDIGALRETVVVEIGEQHLAQPGHDRRPARGHRPADRACGRRTATTRRSTACSTSSQIVLLDSRRRARARATASGARASCSERAYVVDLAWLRSTPWRERIAATFDPPHLRPELQHDLGGHRPPPPRLGGGRRCCSSAGWRRGWAGSRRRADAARRRRSRAARTRAARTCAAARARPDAAGAAAWPACRSRRPRAARCRSTAGRAACARTTATSAARTASGRSSARRAARSGILGEGIRQALLRDPTYGAGASCDAPCRGCGACAPTLSDR